MDWVTSVDELRLVSLDVARYVLDDCDDYKTAARAVDSMELVKKLPHSRQGHVDLVLKLKDLVERRLICQMSPLDRSLRLSRLVARVLVAEGRSKELSACGDGTFRLPGTTQKCSLANVKRALDKLRQSTRLVDQRTKLCVSSIEFNGGEEKAVASVLSAINKALRPKTTARRQSVRISPATENTSDAKEVVSVGCQGPETPPKKPTTTSPKKEAKNKLTQTPPRRRTASEVLAAKAATYRQENPRIIDELSEEEEEDVDPPAALTHGSCRDELELRGWLASLGICVPVLSPSSNPLRDPSRNGAILCELASRRSDASTEDILVQRGRCKPPSNITSASRRARAALEVLDVSDCDFWTLLGLVRSKGYAYVPTTCEKRPWLLPYTDEERYKKITRLEEWLSTSIWIQVDDLLKRVLSALNLKCSAFHKATTHNLRFANVSKAVNILQDWRVQLRRTHCTQHNFARRVTQGDWSLLFPFLDDCYRLARATTIIARREIKEDSRVEEDLSTNTYYRHQEPDAPDRVPRLLSLPPPLQPRRFLFSTDLLLRIE